MQHRLGRFRRRSVAIVSLTAVLSATLVGCTRETDEKMTPVVGKVTVGGKPLTTGSVTFHPDTGKGNSTQHIPVGMLDGNANYALKSATADGAPPGWYKVTVTAQAPIDESNPYALPKHLIDPRFGDVETSGLTVEVVENAAPGAYDFELTK